MPSPTLPFIGKCEWCGDPFRYNSPINAAGDGPRKRRKFCSRACGLAEEHQKRRKLPDADKVAKLYKAGLSTVKIGRMYGCNPVQVSRTLKKIGVPLRPAHGVAATKCAVPGCASPTHKRKHNQSGTLYGTLCKFHQNLKISKKNPDYNRWAKQIPQKQWKLKNL